MVDMAREIDFIERDGIFAFDDGNLAARCFTFAIGQLDIARGVDARAAFARGLDFGTVDDDIAFAAVRGQRAVSKCHLAAIADKECVFIGLRGCETGILDIRRRAIDDFGCCEFRGILGLLLRPYFAIWRGPRRQMAIGRCGHIAFLHHGGRCRIFVGDSLCKAQARRHAQCQNEGEAAVFYRNVVEVHHNHSLEESDYIITLLC